jgi:Mg/Co/Ni transporter MgtE
VGVVSLKELVLARPETPVEDLMSRDLVTVRAADDQELAAGVLQRLRPAGAACGGRPVSGRWAS